MGYTTDFYGRIAIDPPLNPAEIAYLRAFNNTRRMDRTSGPYFVGGSGIKGQGDDTDIRDYNNPPQGQPGLWCGWMPTGDGAALEWDGIEKFYEAEEWMCYLIGHFLAPGAQAQKHPGGDPPPEFARFTFDHVLNGVIDAQGEDCDDRWRLVVTDNTVTRRTARIVWE